MRREIIKERQDKEKKILTTNYEKGDNQRETRQRI